MGTTSTELPAAPSPLRNLPNQLTLSRFVLAAVLFALVAFEQWLACLVVFLVAAVTDWLDGFLARRYKLGTDLGRNLDPMADKVLVCGAFIFLLPVPGAVLQPWMVTIVVLRELIITGLRSYLEGQGAKFGADWFGKLKMWFQSVALVAIFVRLCVQTTAWATFSAAVWDDLIGILLYATVIATALSGMQYLYRAALLLRKK
jgi:CDP-diacylglycerol---glycerol-3-phosphate 3-phosphatidyltransferase